MEKIKGIIEAIKPLDKDAMKKAKERQDFLTKPQGSLGVLEELSIKVAGITGTSRPKIKDKVIITMAGDHGVVEEGVSAFPQEVTPQMVYNFLRGGAGINVLAKHAGARVVVVDMGVATDLEPNLNVVNKKIAYGTQNMAKGPAMTREEAIRAVEAGIEVVEEELKNGIDIIGIGDMGIGNTTPSSAIVAAITGKDVKDVTGRGTGVDDKTFEIKVDVIKKSLEVNKPDPKDPIDVLTKVGGLEIGGMVGVVLAGAKNRIPVVIDGFISGAAALIASELAPQTKDYMIAAHQSVEAGHKILLDHIAIKPLLDLNLRLGEGTGAALGISLTEAGVKVLNEMATFADAGVSESTE
ncbi:MAG: nicotinate-nucleotide--dimethylbenzimidazole phosphoribosyltransferase [Candidatus Hydrothermarchaeales archaeon]